MNASGSKTIDGRVPRAGLLLAVVTGLLATETGAAAAQESAARARAWIANSRILRSKYYEVQTDFPPELAEAHAAHMDLTCEAYIRMFQGLSVKRPSRLRLFMFQEQGDYLAVLRHAFDHDATGSQGLCMSRKGSVTLLGYRGPHGDDRFRSLLQHEGFHQFAAILFPGLPKWINEGLAEVFERGVPVDGTLVIGEVRKRDRSALDAGLEKNSFVPFAQFFAARDWSHQLRSGAASTNYLQAWSMSHFFLYADGGAHRPGFLKFLTLLNKGAKPDAAWLASFGTPNFAAMEAKWIAYVRGLEVEDYRTTIRRLAFLAAGVRELHDKKIVPLTLDDLRTELRKTGFEHTSELFGESKSLRAADADVFDVAGANDEAHFLLVDQRGKEVDPERPPRTRNPLRVVTRGMQAQNLAVEWVRQRGEHQPRLGLR